jgi:hypothetical protein
MAKQKQELAVIDFTQFSVAQLPELKGKKEEIASVIEANPIVEIVDNATYESAKKSRTAVRSLRTSLESEQKTVKKRIKENVLDVVDKEYDLLVALVKGSEQLRQEPIDAWEIKKENERKEKERLEQARIDDIKTRISDYVASWKEAFGFMVFANIKDVLDDFHESNNTFDKTLLQEFDVLFDREVSTLAELLDSKISTLKEQEQIRIDNLLIQEKNVEQTLIQEWQRTWSANIDTLSVSDIADVKSILAKSKLANLKHYVSGYEEIYLSTEKRLHSQIEFVSKAEEQRIAQDKLDQEKKEFEEKQLLARFEERKKKVIELGLVDDGEDNLILGDLCFTYGQLFDFTDDNFNTSFDFFEQKIQESKKPIETFEVVDEEIIEFPAIENVSGVKHVDPINVLPSNTTDKIEEIANNDAFLQTEEVLYHGIYKNVSEHIASFELTFRISDLPKFEHLTIKELLEPYSVPTLKQ